MNAFILNINKKKGIRKMHRQKGFIKTNRKNRFFELVLLVKQQEEMDKLVCSLATAEDNLQALNKHFNNTQI